MPSTFTRTLFLNAKYYPTLYSCRAHILDHLFAVIGNGMKWVDGRLGPKQTTKKLEQEFRLYQKQSRRIQEELNARVERFCLTRGIPRTPSKSHTPALRTDASVMKVLRDFEHPQKMRNSRDRLEKRRQSVLKSPPSDRVFYTLCDSSACNNVPSDIRTDWLLGIGEFLQMVIRWDCPAQVASAQQTLANLEKRFGPLKSWSRHKRGTPLPPVPKPRDISGRLVRVALPGERSWAEHRPDLGVNIYRSLNTTLATLRTSPDADCPSEFQGKRVHFRWGHLFTATEKKYGLARPLLIIGQDITPTKEHPSQPA